jgi:hypothetical protein
MPTPEVIEGPWTKYQQGATAPEFDRQAALAETDKALGLPAGFSAAQIQVESGGNPKARSSAGAMGLAQVMPETLAVVSKRLGRELDPDNEKDAVDIHREVMRENLTQFKDPAKALMAYNGGWNPDKWGNPETAAYVGKVQAAMKSGQNPVMAAAEKVANAVIPSAQAAETGKPWERYASPATPAADETGPWTKYAASPEPDAPKRSTMDSVAQGAGNFLAGAVRGAGSIGATLIAPYDIAKDALDGKGLSLESNRQRRADMDGALQAMGAEPESWMYRGGKLAGEIAGTAGTGGVLANGVRAVGATRAMTGLEPLTNAVAAGLQTGGFRVGELAGTGLGTATRVATGAVTGGASAALVNPEDAGIGAAIGGAFPGAVQAAGVSQAAIVRSMRSILGAASPEVRTLALRAQELGIKIPADRLLDSKALNAMASSLNYIPLSGRTATEEAMNAQLNKALSRTFGQDSSNVTQALRRAQDQLGGKFETTLTANGVAFDRQLLDDLATVYNKAETELGSEALRPIDSKIKEITAKGESGLIDGRAAYAIKRDLDRLGRGSAPNAWHAVELKRVLMDALDRSLGPEKAAAFATVRQQYGNMLSLEKLAKNGVEGEISVARLANLPNINNAALQEIADIAAQFVRPREAMHGAAQRVIGASGAASAAVFGGAGAAGAVMGAGRVANTMLNSQAMRKAILNPTVRAAEPATMGRLAQGMQRALPLTGGVLATQASAHPNTTQSQDEPPVRIELNGMAQPDRTEPATDPAQGPGAQDEPSIPDAVQSAAEIDPAHAFTSEPRPDGTLAINGNPQALHSALVAAGIPARSIVRNKAGVMVGRTQAARVQYAIERMHAATAEPEVAADAEPSGRQPGLVSDAESGSAQSIADNASSVSQNGSFDAQNSEIVSQGELMGSVAPEGQESPQIVASNAALAPEDAPQVAINSVANTRPNENTWAAFPAATGTLGVPREAMPQISTDQHGALVDFLGARGVDAQQGEVDANALKPTQAEFSQEKVDNATELASDGRPVLISSDGHVLDGHHQWLSKLQTGEPVNAIQLGAPIEELLPMVNEFPGATQAAGGLQDDTTSGRSEQAAQAPEAQHSMGPNLDRIQRLRDAGEHKVADLLQRSQDRNKTMSDVQTELASMQAASPGLPHHGNSVFNDHYQQQRLAGSKPAEASAHAGMMSAVQLVAPEIGMPEAAVKALAAKLKDLPIDEAPGFVERFTRALIEKGVVQPFEGSGRLASMLEDARDSAMHGALDSLYGEPA